MPMLEVWLDVIGYAGKYQVSNHGRVKSCDPRTGRWRQIGGSIRPGGYRIVQLWLGNHAKNYALHRLVADTFDGTSDGPIVRHLDGIPSHNYAWNLRRGTYSENVYDSIRHGTFPRNAWKRGVTHCKWGHPFDEVNTRHYINARGTPARCCKACGADYARKRRSERKALA